MTPQRLAQADPLLLRRLSALCLRSKGYWGYSADFLTACKQELSVHANHLSDDCAMIGDVGAPVAFVHVAYDAQSAHVEKLFVDPPAIGAGHGATLFNWAVDAARARSALCLDIVADPGACSFYRHMGAVQYGTVPSGSISNRSLPVLRFTL